MTTRQEQQEALKTFLKIYKHINPHVLFTAGVYSLFKFEWKKKALGKSFAVLRGMVDCDAKYWNKIYNPNKNIKNER